MNLRDKSKLLPQIFFFSTCGGTSNAKQSNHEKLNQGKKLTPQKSIIEALRDIFENELLLPNAQHQYHLVLTS